MSIKQIHSYQVAPTTPYYQAFIHEGIKEAQNLPDDYSILPVLICDLSHYPYLPKNLIIDIHGDIWISSKDPVELKGCIIKQKHHFIALRSIIGCPLWLNLRYCSKYQNYQHQENDYTLVNYWIFYYQLTYQRDLFIFYPAYYTQIKQQNLTIPMDIIHNAQY